MVSRLLLIRHGVSTANLDPAVYLRDPDHLIPLAEPEGKESCQRAGELLRDLAVDPRAVCAWHSPYRRCFQTQEHVLECAFGDAAASVFRRESFLLREQEFGDWDGLSEAEIATKDPSRAEFRKKLEHHRGAFYFRFPFGESRADVVQRTTMFVGKLHRSSFETHVISLHGVTQRALRMSWFNYPVTWFEHEPNPKNGSVVLIERDKNGAWHERYM